MFLSMQSETQIRFLLPQSHLSQILQTYLLAKFGDHRSYRHGDINSYINFYINILEKAELTASICHISKFLKSPIPIYNPKSQIRLAEKQVEGENAMTNFCNKLPMKQIFLQNLVEKDINLNYKSHIFKTKALT